MAGDQRKACFHIDSNKGSLEKPISVESVMKTIGQVWASLLFLLLDGAN